MLALAVIIAAARATLLVRGFVAGPAQVAVRRPFDKCCAAQALQQRSRLRPRAMSSVAETLILGKIVPPDAHQLEQAGAKLRQGGLVAFPTETVYGLGANALLDGAVRSVFVAKGRPLTDPLIVHVTDAEAALQVLDFKGQDEVSSVLTCLNIVKCCILVTH
jgi:Telomere recombination